uniref:Uncharacterized protein n=1 Tax=Anguilla anguilla TaxID=7936 RepID=A0A0E9QXJ1_ANGAN
MILIRPKYYLLLECFNRHQNCFVYKYYKLYVD